MKLSKSLVKHTPEILSGVAALGVIGTAVLSGRASVKSADIWNDETKSTKDKVKSVWKYYVPTALTGFATIASIIFSTVTGRKQTIAVAGACTIATTSYQKYRDKVKEKFGFEAHRKIVEELGGEIAQPENIYATGFITTSLNLEEIKEKECIFYERYSNRYFISKLNKVLQAEYHLNRNYMLSGAINVNEFYNFLGLAPIQEGNELGWSMGDDLYWIDFDHYPAKMKDGTEYFVIDFVFDPSIGFEDR